MENPFDYNPPAFPLVTADYEMHGAPYREWNPGMTLRDYFAGQVLAGYCAAPDIRLENITPEKFAKSSYAFADAMLAERAKVPA